MDALDPGSTERQPQIHLSDVHWEQMRMDVAQRSPEEACGLLIGSITSQDYFVSQVIPATNILHSPVRYRMDPYEQLKAFEHIEAQGLELVGIYHSHPQGPELPSQTDVSEAYYPEIVHLIWSVRKNAWKCRAFLIQSGEVQEVPIFRLETPSQDASGKA